MNFLYHLQYNFHSFLDVVSGREVYIRAFNSESRVLLGAGKYARKEDEVYEGCNASRKRE